MGVILLAAVMATNHVCNAAVCPMNQNAMIWENDRFGAYLYGLGNYHHWSGVAFKTAKFTYWAGSAWSLAGEVTTAGAWHDIVRNFQKGLKK